MGASDVLGTRLREIAGCTTGLGPGDAFGLRLRHLSGLHDVGDDIFAPRPLGDAAHCDVVDALGRPEWQRLDQRHLLILESPQNAACRRPLDLLSDRPAHHPRVLRPLSPPALIHVAEHALCGCLSPWRDQGRVGKQHLLDGAGVGRVFLAEAAADDEFDVAAELAELPRVMRLRPARLRPCCACSPEIWVAILRDRWPVAE